MVSPTKRRKPTGNAKGTSSSNLNQASHHAGFFKSAFAPAGDLFAYVSLAVDKHRMRVYDTSTGRAIAEQVLSHPVSSIAWLQSLQDGDDDVVAEESSRKKRKRRKSSTKHSQEASTVQILGLGLSNGTIIIFSPARGRVITTLSHPSSTTPILAIAPPLDPASHTLWTSCGDGTLRTWDIRSNTLTQTWTTEDRIPSTSLSLIPDSSGIENNQNYMLSAHHSIRLLSVTPDLDEISDGIHPATEIVSLPGHASPIASLTWLPNSRRFLSSSESERVVSLWEVATAGGIRGKMYASISLDSDCRQVDICTASHATEIFAVSASGTVSIFALPDPEGPSFNETKKKRRKQEVLTLTPNSTISISITSTSKDTQASEATIIAAQPVPASPGQLNVVRLAGMRPVFERVKYLDDNGAYLLEITVSHKGNLDLDGADDSVLVPHHRYGENEGVALKSGVELSEDPNLEDIAQMADGELDVNLAELSLGQRLKAASGSALAQSSGDAAQEPSTTAKLTPAPTVSLTRTLTQALHSSDSQLLETCLMHSDPKVVKDTVRTLPPQLTIPLINALTERLGRGGRKKAGGASTQKGGTLVVWLRAVLVLHTSYLMTIPDLVSRLAALHATLTSRSVLQERLLALNGRLDLVLSQIELKTAPGPSQTRVYKRQNHRKNLTRYVEGESSEEESRMDIETNGVPLEVDSGDENGSVQDIELGDESGEDWETEEETEGEESDSDGDGSNGFIDDEAEENWEEDESDESDE